MKSLWEEKAECKDKLDILVYRSRLIGQEPKLCVWGGGNTSTKCEEKDFFGRTQRILRVKGSGSDLKASEPKHFSPLYLDKLLEATSIEQMSDEEMVSFMQQCLADPKAPRPSIEALLHAFIPQEDIDHSHADAILTLTDTKNNRAVVTEVFGDELLWIPYIKPGFTLAKRVAAEYAKNPNTKGAILEKHGLITWANDGKKSYELTIEMVTRAEKYISAAAQKKKWSEPAAATLSQEDRTAFLNRYLPHIRRMLSQRERVLLHYTDSDKVLEFVNAQATAKVSQLGPATPDHMLRTKRLPLYIELPKGIENLSIEDLSKQIEAYAKRHEKYYEKHRQPDMFMLDPYPKVILIPGIGMITSGKDLKSAQIVAEIYEHSVDVMMGAEAVDQFVSLSETDAFDMEYWSMELYKLSLAPPEAELARQVGLVTGAAGGIGRGAAKKLAQAGAYVVIGDINKEKVEQTADELNKELKSDRIIPYLLDVTDEKTVEACFNKIVQTFGGIDFVVSNAGVAHVASIDRLQLSDWNKSFSVNSTGHFLISKKAIQVMREQGMAGSLVFIASKNVLAPGKEFGAYSAAKASQTQLARILAIENGEFGIRVNLVNPDGVFEGSGLWDEIKPSRAKTWGITPDELEKHYQKRNLMQVPILPEDVAESVLFLTSKRSSKTTGCILTVDGGIKEAFPR